MNGSISSSTVQLVFEVGGSQRRGDECCSDAWSADLNHEIADGIRVTLALISITAIIGNALVCLTVIYTPALFSKSYLLVVNLALGDLLGGVFILLYYCTTDVISFTQLVAPPSHGQPPGFPAQLICKLILSQYPLWVCLHAGFYNLAGVTAELYAALCYPIWYRLVVTKRRIFLVAFVCWFLAFLQNGYMFHIFEVHDAKCQIQWHGGDAYQKKLIGLMIFSLNFLIPMSFLSIAYMTMSKTLKKSAERRRDNRSGSETMLSLSFDKARNRLARTMSVVFVCFFILWGPNGFIYLAYNMGFDINFKGPIFLGTLILGFVNCSINPFLYAYKNKVYRQGLKRLLTLDSSRVRHGRGGGASNLYNSKHNISHQGSTRGGSAPNTRRQKLSRQTEMAELTAAGIGPTESNMPIVINISTEI